MTHDVIPYLREHFPALALDGGLFYRWPIGIRFDLGGRGDADEDFAEVRRQAATLFEAIFVPGDACTVVSQDWPAGDPPNAGRTHLSTLSDFAIEQAVGLRPPSGCERIREVDDEEASAHTLTWFEQSARDCEYSSILEGIANADRARSPALCSRIYFIDPATKVIIHMYDDRGLDVIAKTKGILSPLYRTFNGWLLEHDRRQVDSLFGEERTA